jgi:hypothetical protein
MYQRTKMMARLYKRSPWIVHWLGRARCEGRAGQTSLYARMRKQRPYLISTEPVEQSIRNCKRKKCRRDPWPRLRRKVAFPEAVRDARGDYKKGPFMKGHSQDCANRRNNQAILGANGVQCGIAVEQRNGKQIDQIQPAGKLGNSEPNALVRRKEDPVSD